MAGVVEADMIEQDGGVDVDGLSIWLRGAMLYDAKMRISVSTSTNTDHSNITYIKYYIPSQMLLFFPQPNKEQCLPP